MPWLPSPCLSHQACPALRHDDAGCRDGGSGEVSVWQPAVSSVFLLHSPAPIALPCCRPTRTLILCPGRSCPRARHAAPSPLPSLLNACQPLHFQAVLSNLTHPEDHPSPPAHLPPAGWPTRLALQQVLQPPGPRPVLRGPPAWAWAPRPGLGCLVSAGLPRSTSTETWLQPHVATGLQASQPAAAGGRASQRLPPPAPAATSQSWCGGRGWHCQGPGWLQGETPVVPGCGRLLQRGAHPRTSPEAAGRLPSPLARSERRGLRQEAAWALGPYL